jgi:molybdate transport system ATP-binding protein
MIEARLYRVFPAGPESAAFTLDVDLRVGAGVTAVFGPSGAGKSLTLDMLAGFVAPDKGRILLGDRIVFDREAGINLPPQKRRCGYVLQNYALFPHMTVRENVLFGANHLHKRDRHRTVHELLDRFQLNEVGGRRPSQISGGQKQRCSIARALAANPEIILLDEPARGLDAPLRAELYEVIHHLQDDFAKPVLLISHSIEECLEIASEMLVYRDGRIVQSGPPIKVCEQPANLDLARLLGIYNVLPVEIRALDPARNTSVMRFGEHEIGGEYYPGKLKGDRLHLLVTPRQLKALPRTGRPGANQIPATMVRSMERADSVLLDFEGGIQVDVPRSEYLATRDWLVQFPSRGMRLL